MYQNKQENQNNQEPFDPGYNIQARIKINTIIKEYKGKTTNCVMFKGVMLFAKSKIFIYCKSFSLVATSLIRDYHQTNIIDCEGYFQNDKNPKTEQWFQSFIITEIKDRVLHLSEEKEKLADFGFKLTDKGELAKTADQNTIKQQEQAQYQEFQQDCDNKSKDMVNSFQDKVNKENENITNDNDEWVL